MNRRILLCSSLLGAVFTLPSVEVHAQAAPDVQTPVSLVQPALDKVAQAGSSVDLNKWKGGNGVKSEVDANLGSIQKDLQDTLPPLLGAAEKSPHSIPANLRVLLNLDALYSVLLRVSIAGRSNAPKEQGEALDGALLALDGARRDLGDRITASAASQETQISQLQTQLQQQTAALEAAQKAAATPPPPPPTKPAKKRVVRKKKPVAPATPAAAPAKPAAAPAK